MNANRHPVQTKASFQTPAVQRSLNTSSKILLTGVSKLLKTYLSTSIAYLDKHVQLVNLYIVCASR